MELSATEAGLFRESDAGIAHEAGFRAGLAFCKRRWQAHFRFSVVLSMV